MSGRFIEVYFVEATAIRWEEANDRGIEVYFVEAIAFMREMRLGASIVWVKTGNSCRDRLRTLLISCR
jgi:hypothetical protein